MARKKKISSTVQLLILNVINTFQRTEKCGQQNIFVSEHTWELTPPPSYTPKLSKNSHSCSVNMNGKKFILDEPPWGSFFFSHVCWKTTCNAYLIWAVPSWSDLSWPDLSRADLSWTDRSWASLSRPVLIWPELTHPEPNSALRDLIGANWAELIWSELDVWCGPSRLVVLRGSSGGVVTLMTLGTAVADFGHNGDGAAPIVKRWILGKGI